ncbi:MAG: pyridoxine 5'-phosphate synthase [Victivallales bacterium]
MKLGVNIDHVATLRQLRGVTYPSVLKAADLAMHAGAAGITAHLREDRRHMNDADLEQLAASGHRLNMEMAVTDEMVAICSRLRPAACCLVPEKRQELTTEGGLDVAGHLEQVKAAAAVLASVGVEVSLFIDPDREQIRAAKECGAPVIELHTGAYANAKGKDSARELRRLVDGAEFAHSLGITVNAGHGIDYENIKPLLAEVPYLNELNIGHSIICESVYSGLEAAVMKMLALMSSYKKG